MARRYTTKKQDAAFIMSRLADAGRHWRVGDPCLTYDMRGETTVSIIDGDIVTLANGDKMHRSKMHSVEHKKV